MITSRGWWMILIAFGMTLAGLLLSERGHQIIVILGLTLMGWIGFEWLLFSLRVHHTLRAIRLKREIWDEKRSVPLLWQGREFEVRLLITNSSWLGLSYVFIQDRIPMNIRLKTGNTLTVTDLRGKETQELHYRFETLSIGEICFDGIAIQLSDLQGFFYVRTFIHTRHVFPVLPELTNEEGKRRTNKSHNLLPPPGVHRLRKSGGGGDLLDLRDYRPGDPPKMIAWKPSARRDRLITKEFETEVPIRCTLFVDSSQSVRSGLPGQTMLQQLVSLASGIAQATLADRDHVGLVVFDEGATDILAPARDSTVLIQLLNKLAKAASKSPMSPNADMDLLLRLAQPLAGEVYPDSLRKDVNQLPWSMFWDPVMDSTSGWTVLILLASPLLVLWEPIYQLYARISAGFTGQTESLPFWIFFGILTLLGPAMGLVFWFYHGLRGQWGTRYLHKVRRKRLAALLASLDHAPLGQVTHWLHDDTVFAVRVQQFLADHHIRYPVRLYDDTGRYLLRSDAKIPVLASALQRSIARAHDNELFVLLVDLIELDQDLEPLTKTIKVAVARHHDVVVVCPWLQGVPKIDPKTLADPVEDLKEVLAVELAKHYRGVEALLMRETAFQYYLAYQRIRKVFGKMGVTLVTADEGEPVRLILHRIDRLRGVRKR